MADTETHDTTKKCQYKLRIGNTFMEATEKSNLYNTLKLDFTPASCNSAKNMHLYCEGGDSVLVAIPNDDSEYTFFKGSKKPSPKECILIIDHKTNTATLERVSNNFSVKRTKNMDENVLNLLPPLVKKKPMSPEHQPTDFNNNCININTSLSDADKQELINDLMISESDD